MRFVYIYYIVAGGGTSECQERILIQFEFVSYLCTSLVLDVDLPLKKKKDCTH